MYFAVDDLTRDLDAEGFNLADRSSLSKAFGITGKADGAGKKRQIAALRLDFGVQFLLNARSSSGPAGHAMAAPNATRTSRSQKEKQNVQVEDQVGR